MAQAIPARLPLLLSLALALGAVMLSRASTDTTNTADASRSPRVRVVAVRSVHRGSDVSLTGTVRARRRATLSFTIGARLASREARVGDEVSRDEVLARLDTREVELARSAAAASLDRARAELAQAERDRTRAADLLATKAGTRQELEAANTAVEALAAVLSSAVAELAQADRLLGETVLRAPFSGTITRVHAQAGERIAPGDSVFQLSGHGALEVEIRVPESLVSALTEGASVEISFPLLAVSSQKGVVSHLSRASQDGLFPAIIDIPPAAGVRAGTTVQIAVNRSTDGGLAVPLAAILDPSGADPFLFRLDDGRVQRVAVIVERLYGDEVIVRGDLAPGHQVVVAGQGRLLDGDAVEVMP